MSLKMGEDICETLTNQTLISRIYKEHLLVNKTKIDLPTEK